MKILQTSDSHLGITKEKSIRKMIRQWHNYDFDLILHCGDYSGTHTGFKPTKHTVKMIRDKFPDKPFVSVIGNHDCISEDTEILTENGWRSISTIDKSDLVATMDYNRNLEWQKINDIIIRDFNDKDENIYTYDTTHMSMQVTSNHRVYTYNRRSKKIEVKLAKECSNDFSVINAVNSNTSVDLTNEEIKLAAWLCTDSHINKYGKVTLYQRKSNVHKITELLTYMDIPFKLIERNRNIEEIQGKMLKSCETACEIYFSTETSKKLLNNLSIVSNKKLPKWYKELSNTQWNIFIETLIDADGSNIRNSDSCFVFYGRKRICEEVQVGAVLHGWRASLTEYRDNQWRVNLSTKSETRILDFTKSANNNYKGKVWCISVKNKNFICRRNNKVHITGNCWTAGTKFKSVYGGYGHKHPTYEAFMENYNKIVEMFKDYNVHFLDEDGVYTNENWFDIKIIGHSGWYAHPNPPTNDIGYLPKTNPLGINPNAWMLKRAEDKLQEQFDQLDKNYDTKDTVIFVSHFPVIKTGPDYKGRWEDFSWSESIGNFIRTAYGCKYFFNGHAHQYHNGPLRYESGSDYCNPNFHIVTVI